MTPELIIFDCDGVLVDTETIAAEITRDTLADLGWKISFDDAVYMFMGRSAKDNLKTIAEHIGETKAALYLAHWRETAGERMKSVTAIPGIHAILPQLDRTCVASSGAHEKMRMTLGAAGLYDYFAGRIFSASEVENGKPAPDLFLHAAQQMGTLPETCVVVEDSVPGVSGARAAGMTVFGYANLTRPEALEEAGAIPFDDMRNLPALISKL